MLELYPHQFVFRTLIEYRRKHELDPLIQVLETPQQRYFIPCFCRVIFEETLNFKTLPEEAQRMIESTSRQSRENFK